jgi:hypothetical protein
MAVDQASSPPLRDELVSGTFFRRDECLRKDDCPRRYPKAGEVKSVNGRESARRHVPWLQHSKYQPENSIQFPAWLLDNNRHLAVRHGLVACCYEPRSQSRLRRHSALEGQIVESHILAYRLRSFEAMEMPFRRQQTLLGCPDPQSL